MAWDGAALWITDELNHIYQVDPLRWSIIMTLNVPTSGSSNPRDVAWEPFVNNLWAGYQSSGLIRKHNPANGQVLGEFSSPYTWSTQGLTWDGWFLWATGGQQTKREKQIFGFTISHTTAIHASKWCTRAGH